MANQEIPTTEQPKKRSWVKWILIGGGAILAMCVLCFVVTLLLPDSDSGSQVADAPTTEVQATAAPDQPTAAPKPTDPPQPTNTQEPTDTPQPTSTPVPTATPDPNLVPAGTHLIGTDIQPGLYQGQAGGDFAGSCYWERLSDVSGDFEDILANDNSIGQFYIQIPETDFALTTACEIRVFRPEENIAAEFPVQLDPGNYLIGVDIQPGMYRGQAGEDFENSCYWERLSGFTGDFEHILANDNSTGQFFIQVASSDFGLHTSCPLEFVPQ